MAKFSAHEAIYLLNIFFNSDNNDEHVINAFSMHVINACFNRDDEERRVLIGLQLVGL